LPVYPVNMPAHGANAAQAGLRAQLADTIRQAIDKKASD
jgi:hypothetical protein